MTYPFVSSGTDHARADGLKGTRTDLKCDPYCLFNLTSDIGERNDLGQNPAYQEIAQKIAARLKCDDFDIILALFTWLPSTNAVTTVPESAVYIAGHVCTHGGTQIWGRVRSTCCPMHCAGWRASPLFGMCGVPNWGPLKVPRVDCAVTVTV